MLDLFVLELSQLSPGSVVQIGHLPAVYEFVELPAEPAAIVGHVNANGIVSVPQGGGVVLAAPRTEERLKTPAGFVLSVELLDAAGQPSGARYVAAGDSPDACAEQARIFFRKRAAELQKKASDPAHDAEAAALALGKVEPVAKG